MNESIYKYFDVGIVSFMAYPSIIKGDSDDLVSTIRKIAVDDYFSAIELTWIKDDQKRKQVADMIRSSHLKPCYGAQPRLLTTGMNPNDLEEAKRQAAEQTLLEAIDEAEELGCGGIAFLSGKWEEKTKDQAYDQLMKTTLNLCAYAKKKNMLVELEVFDYDIAKKALIGPASYAAKFAADVREQTDNFGLLIDLSHIPMTYETNEYVVRTLRPYLTHFHIGNTVVSSPEDEGYGDEHQRFGFPNSSNDVNQVLDFLRVLKAEGFFKQDAPYVLSFEVKPWQAEDPELVIANAKRVLNRAWALL